VYRIALKSSASQRNAKILLTTIIFKVFSMNQIYIFLMQKGLLDYGSVFSADIIRSVAGVSIPEKGTFKQFQDAQLAELQAVTAVRDELLKDGKYLKKDGENYRILLPSENAEQVRKMNDSADRKYKRAILLQKMTPKNAFEKETNKDSSHSKIFDLMNKSRIQSLLA
jgi:hypothetical protein